MIEVLHRKDNLYQLPPPWGLSCQVDYLRRCDVWERGVVAIPHRIPVSHFLDGSPISSVYFDLETYWLPIDFGHGRYSGYDRAEVIPKLRLGLAVTIDNHGRVECWDECQARQLADYITTFDQIVSYNGLNFDNYVLSAYTSPEGIQAVSEKTFDLFQHLATSKGIKRRLAQWSEEYFGISNHTKYLLSLGYGFEER